MHVTSWESHGKQVVLMNSRPPSRTEKTAQLSTMSGYLFLVRMWSFLTGVLSEMSGSTCTLLSLCPVRVRILHHAYREVQHDGLCQRRPGHVRGRRRRARRCMGRTPHHLPRRSRQASFCRGAGVTLHQRTGERLKDSLSGPVSPSPSERAVIIASGSQRSMLPRDRFLAVALGEEISCIFVEVPSDTPDSENTPASQGGITP